MGSASMVTLIACGLVVILPALLLLYYVGVFGVNVFRRDEWHMISLIQKAMLGTLSFSDLFAQCNEHRILFPRIAMLIIGRLTRWNNVAEMFFNWILICLTGLLIFYDYRKKFCWSSYPKLLLIFLPASLLLFNFVQYESLLQGINCAIYMMIFGVVATFSLLEVSKKIDAWFILCVLSAILASFSFAAGLLVWPVGFLQMLICEKKENSRKTVLWCLIAAVVFIFYFCGYVNPWWHTPLCYVLKNPLASFAYFLALIGAVLSRDAITAVSLGLIIVFIAAFVITHACKEKLLRKNKIWLSFILFACLCLLATTKGRAGFGIKQALSSRYTPMAILGIVGLYFMAVSVYENFPVKSKNFGARALLALILIGLIASYRTGWWRGRVWRREGRKSAYVLMTYKIQSDENIVKYLHPVPAPIRTGAGFLERNKLNVFSRDMTNTSGLVLIQTGARFFIYTINNKIVSRQVSPILIRSGEEKTITINGWAVDKKANDAASGVFITIDDRIDIPALYGLSSPGVFRDFKNPNLRFSGYMATFSSSILDKGAHTLSIKIVTKDGKGYYWPKRTVDLLIE